MSVSESDQQTGRNLVEDRACPNPQGSRILEHASEALHWIEVILAALSVVFVGLGVVYLVEDLFHFPSVLSSSGLHNGYEDVLSEILLLVVGIELALMLVRRSPESLIEVMFFVVARKMLIKADSFPDLIIGVAALAGLFAIRKYLQDFKPMRSLRRRRFDAS